MRRDLILMVMAVAVLAITWPTFAQREDLPTFQMLSPEEAAKLKEKWPNMSEEERAKFRAEMRQRWQNLSEEEKEKFKAGMRERFGAGRLGPGMGREEQLQVIKVIEEQVVKLRAAIEETAQFLSNQMTPEALTPEALQKLREEAAEESTKIREKLMKARRGRQEAIAAIEVQIAKLKGEGAPIGPPPGALLGELQAIRKMAVEEKAQETAKRLERLIGKYQSELKTRPPEAQQEPPRPERPRGDRPEKTREGGER